MRKQELIQFTIAQCEPGFALVAQSAKGVCAVMVAESPEQVFHEFSDKFAKSQVEDAGGAMDMVADQVVQYIENPRRKPRFKLDMRGTDFQVRVWRAVMQVPFGRTATYGEIACAIGEPAAARAVGTACGKTLLSMVVPCHRVVRSGAANTAKGAPGEGRRKAMRKREGRTQ